MSLDRMILVGGGGHVKILIDAITSTGLYQIDGILDGNIRRGKKILGYPVLGGDKFLIRHKKKEGDFLLANGVGFVKASDRRKVVYEKYKRLGFKFPVIIHRYSFVAKKVRLGDGVQVMAGVIVHPDVVIGEDAIINTAAIIGHDSKIAPHSHISLNAVLGGNVEIGECSHIGMGAKVLQGVKIGAYVTVGAGAVVVKNVKDGKTVVGIPAREIDG